MLRRSFDVARVSRSLCLQLEFPAFVSLGKQIRPEKEERFRRCVYMYYNQYVFACLVQFVCWMCNKYNISQTLNLYRSIGKLSMRLEVEAPTCCRSSWWKTPHPSCISQGQSFGLDGWRIPTEMQLVVIRDATFTRYLQKIRRDVHDIDVVTIWYLTSMIDHWNDMNESTTNPGFCLGSFDLTTIFTELPKVIDLHLDCQEFRKIIPCTRWNL